MTERLEWAARSRDFPASGFPAMAFADSTPAQPPTMLVADDHAMVRFALAEAFAKIGAGPLNWIEASSMREAIDAYRDTDPVVAFIGLGLPDCRGLHCIQRLRAEFGHAKLVVVSGTRDAEVARQAHALGAYGFFHKADSPTLLAEAVAIRCRLKPRLLGTPEPSLFRTHGQGTPKPDLCHRQLEVLDLLLCGFTNEEVARALRLRIGTVKNHVSALMAVLRVESRTQLMRLFD